MDHSLDFVEIVAANGLVQGVSGAIKQLGGYDPQDLVGGDYQDIIHPDDCARAAKVFARALKGKPSEAVKLRYRRKGGSWRTILVSAQNFLEEPAVGGLLILTRDVTEQCAAESLLAQANSKVAKLTAELKEVEDRQRMHLGAELHDDVQQILVGLRMNMEASRLSRTHEAPGESSPGESSRSESVAGELVEEWTELLQKAIDHLHELTVALRKPRINEQGLSDAVRAHVSHVQVFPGQEVAFQTDGSVGKVPPNVALASFRIVQEGLANAIKHSQAAHLHVGLKRVNGCLLVSIGDDGVGFDVKRAAARAAKVGSVGLISMRQRAAMAGGRFMIESAAGAGTRIVASFPVEPFGGRPQPGTDRSVDGAPRRITAEDIIHAATRPTHENKPTHLEERHLDRS
jgi:PAS domain S-box-containing protein